MCEFLSLSRSGVSGGCTEEPGTRNEETLNFFGTFNENTVMKGQVHTLTDDPTLTIIHNKHGAEQTIWRGTWLETPGTKSRHRWGLIKLMKTGKTGKPNMGRETQGRGRQTVTVMMVLFHNTECGSKGNKLKSWLLLLLLLIHFSLRLHRFSLRGCHVMNERLKPEDSTDAIGWCTCATERITPRDDSFFPSHIKDLFKMNDPSLTDRGVDSSHMTWDLTWTRVPNLITCDSTRRN